MDTWPLKVLTNGRISDGSLVVKIADKGVVWLQQPESNNHMLPEDGPGSFVPMEPYMIRSINSWFFRISSMGSLLDVVAIVAVLDPVTVFALKGGR